jgi:hypothetical protein
MSATAKFVKEITVEDPDTKGSVKMEVYKHENGGMFAIDSSFLEQVAQRDEDLPETPEYLIIMDPFTYGDPQVLYLEER